MGQPPDRGGQPIDAAQAESAGPVAAWPATYLRHFPGQAEVLRVFATTKAGGREFATACRRRGWSRATAYRFRDRALRIIALGLARHRVPIENLKWQRACAESGPLEMPLGRVRTRAC